MLEGVNREEMKHAMEDVFDQAVVVHGFADYMRDYDVIVWATADPRTGIAPEQLVYTFKHCVRATVTSAVPPEVWAHSLDDRLMEYKTGVELDGYVWGVKRQELYPGMQFVSPSTDASHWERGLLHEEVTGLVTRPERPHKYLDGLTPARAEELHYLRSSAPAVAG